MSRGTRVVALAVTHCSPARDCRPRRRRPTAAPTCPRRRPSRSGRRQRPRQRDVAVRRLRSRADAGLSYRRDPRLLLPRHRGRAAPAARQGAGSAATTTATSWSRDRDGLTVAPVGGRTWRPREPRARRVAGPAGPARRQRGLRTGPAPWQDVATSSAATSSSPPAAGRSSLRDARRHGPLPRRAALGRRSTRAAADRSTCCRWSTYVRGVVPPEMQAVLAAAGAAGPGGRRPHLRRARARATATTALRPLRHRACQAYGGASAEGPASDRAVTGDGARRPDVRRGAGVHRVLRQQRRLDRRRRTCALPAGAGRIPTRATSTDYYGWTVTVTGGQIDAALVRLRRPGSIAGRRSATARRARRSGRAVRVDRRLRVHRHRHRRRVPGRLAACRPRCSRSPRSTRTTVCSSREPLAGRPAVVACPTSPTRHIAPGAPMRRLGTVLTASLAVLAGGLVATPASAADSWRGAAVERRSRSRATATGTAAGCRSTAPRARPARGWPAARSPSSTTPAPTRGRAGGRIRVHVSADTTDDLVVVPRPGLTVADPASDGRETRCPTRRDPLAGRRRRRRRRPRWLPATRRWRTWRTLDGQRRVLRRAASRSRW